MFGDLGKQPVMLNIGVGEGRVGLEVGLKSHNVESGVVAGLGEDLGRVVMDLLEVILKGGLSVHELGLVDEMGVLNGIFSCLGLGREPAFHGEAVDPFFNLGFFHWDQGFLSGEM